MNKGRLLAAAVVANLMGCALLAQAQTKTVAGKIPGQFAVSPSGAATYRIPIEMPPGVAGMQPQLALSYNSQAGNGLLGVGWNIEGLSAITRCPQTMAQDGKRGSVKFDSEDRFCLDGQRLILVNGTYGAANSEYRTEFESFSKITAYGSAGNGPAYFEVKTKDGRALEYGKTDDSRIEAVKALGANPKWLTGTVRVWANNKVSDIRGNYYTIDYQEDGVAGAYYPKRVDYAISQTTGKRHVIDFSLSSDRPDVRKMYLSGAVSFYEKRVTGLIIFSENELIKKYDFAYSELFNGVARLVKIGMCDAQGACVKPTLPHYAESNSLLAADSVKSTGISPSYGGGARWVDADADGKIDYCGEGWSVGCLFSVGIGFEERVNLVFQSPPYPTVFNWKAEYDYDGDGLVDYCGQAAIIGGDSFPRKCVNSSGVEIVFSFFGAGTVNPFTTVLSGDLDGDGRNDLCELVISNAWLVGHWVLCHESGGSSTTPRFTVPWVVDIPKSPRMLDVNGDGLADYCYVNPIGAPVCYMSTGFSFDAAEVSGSVNLVPESANWVDFNGDGLMDLCGVSTGNKLICNINTGAGFAGVVESGVMDLGIEGSRYWVDSNGDGRVDYCRELVGGKISCTLSTGVGFGVTVQSGLINLGSLPKRWADVDGDGFLDYCRVVNGGIDCLRSVFSGNELKSVVGLIDEDIKVTYSTLSRLGSSAVYSASASRASYPFLSVQPPALVVARVEKPNGVGTTNAIEYSYGGLKAEIGTGRGSLGFRWIKAKEVETGIETYTEYRQDWPYVGLPKLSETRLSGKGNGGLIKRTNTEYACKNGAGNACADVPANCNLEDANKVGVCKPLSQARIFPYAFKTTEESWDLDGSAYPSIANEVDYALNGTQFFGEVSKVTVSTSDGYSKVTTNEYHPADTNQWILGRLKRASVVSVAPDSAGGTVGGPTSSPPASTTPSAPVSNSSPSAASVAWLIPIISQLLLD